MKISSLLFCAAGSLVLASDSRDLDGDVWASAASPLGKRQSTWNPPANLVVPLNEVWNHVMATYNNGNGITQFKNYGYDIIYAAQGNLKFCVRWDSGATLTAAQRSAIEASLQKNVRKWTDKLTGFMGWKFDTVNSQVSGWAARDQSLLPGSLSVPFYSTKDSSGTPECDVRCARFFHQDNNYSGCPGGAANRYDMSLWLTAGMSGGAGGDWGQRVGSEYFLANLDNPHIFLHEFGHTLALDDFYDWTPTGVGGFIMQAGSSSVITDFDIWMMRDFWRHIASRFGGVTPATTTTRTTTTRTGSAQTTTRAQTTTVRTTAGGGSGTGSPLYGQCGGTGWTGPKTCAQGTCTFSNEWYSQCVP